MSEFDVPDVVASEKASYTFPWSEGIFRDCLRVGYVCRVVELDHEIIGHAVLSVGAGEAHIRTSVFARRIAAAGSGAD